MRHRKCSVLNCNGDLDVDKTIKLFSLPTITKNLSEFNQEILLRRRASWLEKIKPEKRKCKQLFVCSLHFYSGKNIF